MRRALYPASYDPVHYGHIDIAQRAARLFDELIVAVYDRPNKRLLFTAEERLALVEKSLKHIPNIRVAIYSGLTVDYARKVDAIAIVRGLQVFRISSWNFAWHWRTGVWPPGSRSST